MHTPDYITKTTTQQLKSIRDDLQAKFSEEDKVLRFTISRADKRRAERKIKKLTPQITELTNSINYLETIITQ